MRNLSVAIAATILVLALSVGVSAHTHHRSHESEQTHHLARLAAQEKKAWQKHLARLRAMSPSKRLALKRHDRRIKRLERQQEAVVASLSEVKKVAQTAHHNRKRILRELAEAEKRAWALHLAKLNALSPEARHDALLYQKHLDRVQAQAQRHERQAARMASQSGSRHARREAEHEARLARQQAAHNARAARLAARHAAAVSAHEARLREWQERLAQRAINHQARLAKLQAAHVARLAAKRAHYVALHGDNSSGRSIRFWQTVAAGTPVKVITVDLNDSHVKISAVMARHGNGTSEPFRDMIGRADPDVAVTGTFFSLDNLNPVGDIVIDGSLVHFGGMGTALCITPDNRADMITCDWGRHHDWSSYDFVVACGPRLLHDSRIVLDPVAERFRDRHMLAPNSRIAVGITRGNKIVFAMTHQPIYLGRLAKVMHALGATEAMNLDAGTSTGFYYNGTTLARPGRQLTNMIVVYGNKDRYQREISQLIPAAYRRMNAHWPMRAELARQ